MHVGRNSNYGAARGEELQWGFPEALEAHPFVHLRSVKTSSFQSFCVGLFPHNNRSYIE